jgi:hypothetical protein
VVDPSGHHPTRPSLDWGLTDRAGPVHRSDPGSTDPRTGMVRGSFWRSSLLSGQISTVAGVRRTWTNPRTVKSSVTTARTKQANAAKSAIWPICQKA